MLSYAIFAVGVVIGIAGHRALSRLQTAFFKRWDER